MESYDFMSRLPCKLGFVVGQLLVGDTVWWRAWSRRVAPAFVSSCAC